MRKQNKKMILTKRKKMVKIVQQYQMSEGVARPGRLAQREIGSAANVLPSLLSDGPSTRTTRQPNIASTTRTTSDRPTECSLVNNSIIYSSSFQFIRNILHHHHHHHSHPHHHHH